MSIEEVRSGLCEVLFLTTQDLVFPPPPGMTGKIALRPIHIFARNTGTDAERGCCDEEEYKEASIEETVQGM